MGPWAGLGAPRGGVGASGRARRGYRGGGGGEGRGRWVIPGREGRRGAPCGGGVADTPRGGVAGAARPLPVAAAWGRPAAGPGGLRGERCATLAPYGASGLWMGSPSLTPVQLQSSGEPSATCAAVRGRRWSLHPSLYGWGTRLSGPHPRLGSVEIPARPSLWRGVVSGATRDGWEPPCDPHPRPGADPCPSQWGGDRATLTLFVGGLGSGFPCYGLTVIPTPLPWRPQ